MFLRRLSDFLLSGRILLSSLIFLFSILSKELNASHLMGGEITWECVSSGSDQGKLIFEVKLYRYCAGANLTNSVSLNNPLAFNWGGPSTVTLALISTKDLSINCGDSLQSMNCYDSSRNQNSIEEFVYRSSPVTIYGVPGTYPTGSEWGLSMCCRPSATRLQNLPSSTYYLRSKMFRYINGSTGQADTLGTSTSSSCYDSSPKFAQRPSITLCANNKYHYSHNAYDPDIDSLHYEWAAPMSGVNTFNTWNTGYSTTSQLPNTSIHPLNVPASLDGASGEIEFNVVSPTGLFSTVVKVTSYRAGQPIAETFRDVALSIINCAYTNPPPVVDFYDCGSCPLYPSPARDTVYAGDSVKFLVRSVDIGFLPGGFPQKNILNPSGIQFGHRFGNPDTGCAIPPCATIDTNVTFYSSKPNNWSGVLGLVTTFKWLTDCNHIPNVDKHYVNSANHTFVFNVIDNYCPVPAADSRTFTVTILAPPPIPPPKFLCTQVLSDTAVRVNWVTPISSAQDTFNSFRYYVLYRSIVPNDSFVAIDSIDDISISSYIDTDVDLTQNDYFYYIKGLSSCHSQSQLIESDTVGVINLKGEVLQNGSQVSLQWTPFGFENDFPTTTTNEYTIWEIRHGDTSLVNRQNTTSIQLNYETCYPDSVTYFIEVQDTTKNWACISGSNELNLAVGDSTPPPIQLVDSVSVLVDSTLIIGWTPINQADLDQFYLTHCDTNQIATLNKSVTSYIDLNSDPNQSQISYSLESSDTCGNRNSGLKSIDCHSSIYLTSEFDRCEKAVKLIWTQYSFFNSGPEVEYRVYVKKDGGKFELIDVTFNTSYNISNLEDKSEYCFYVQAWENAGEGPFSSSSNRLCERVELLKEPDFSYLDYVTVIDNKNLEVCLRSDVNADISRYEIFRTSENDSLNVFSYQLKKPMDETDSAVCFTDSLVDVQSNRYTYTLRVYDICNLLVSESNIGTSILTKANWDRDNMHHNLNWTLYHEWPNGVEQYILFLVDENNQYIELERYPVNNSSKENEITIKYRLQDPYRDLKEYCYAIEAVEKAPYFRKKEEARSLSNVTCINNRNVIFLPNAFTPNEDNINDIFRVHGSIEGLAFFKLEIFNRWGELIITIEDPSKGWDGKVNGQYAPFDVYTYRLEYKLDEEEKSTEEIQGTFSLIR